MAEADGGARAWGMLDFRDLPLPLGVLKRLAKLNFHQSKGGEEEGGDRIRALPSGASLALSGVDLQRGAVFRKAGLHACLGSLTTLELARCALGDDGVMHLAAALEKAAVGSPLRIRTLLLRENDLGDTKNKTEGAFSCLCKVLRARGAPDLAVLDLSRNRTIPLRPMCALIEQVSSTLRELDLSHVSITESTQELATLLTAVMRRQQHRRSRTGGGQPSSDACSAFEYLDLKAETTAEKRAMVPREIWSWLHTQTAVRLLQ
ncbi:unnamed protein product [Phytomonas sp. EM1]|nr:unnamed protein product [Phytomonas sp. EM1]|eukprot:CCW65017.1 unnamed protein product [Phytomonas sp. isolate EM1]